MLKKQKVMIKNLIDNFESHIDPNDPTNNCLDVAIITAPEKRTQKTIDKLKTDAINAIKIMEVRGATNWSDCSLWNCFGYSRE